jgi:hypothetical protein
MGLVPFMAIIAGDKLGRLFESRRWLAWGLVILCVLQTGGVAGYVHRIRRIPPATLTGFEYIKGHVADSDCLLYPGAELLAYTGKMFAWSAFEQLSTLFWARMPEDAQVLLHANEIRYIVIPRDRVYDEQKEGRHRNGYPDTLVERMKTWPFLHRLEWGGDDEQLTIYRVDWTDLSPEELLGRKKELIAQDEFLK